MGLSDRDYYREHHRQQQRATAQAGPTPTGRSAFNSPQLSGWWIWAFWFSVIIFGAIGISQVLQARQAGRITRSAPDVSSFPPTGQVHWYIDHPTGQLASLTLEAPASAGQNFVAKLDAWETKAPVAMIPLRAGDVAEVGMPLGRYRLTLIKGSGWLGPGRLFRFTTESREAVHPVEFYRVGNRIHGRHIRLEVLNGNMETKPVR